MHQSVATLISRGTAPEQPVEWADRPKMVKQLFCEFVQIFKKNSRILTNFKTESREFLNYACIVSGDIARFLLKTATDAATRLFRPTTKP